MDRKLLVLLAAALFGVGFAVCADDAVNAKKVVPVAKEVKAGKPADASKPAEVKKDEPNKECPFLKPALLYIPNRLLDLLDIVTIDLGAGPEFGVDAKVTHWLQIGGMYGDRYFLGKDYARQLGGGYSSGWNYGFLCFTSERRYVDHEFGTTMEFLLKRKSLGLAMPDEDFTYTHNIRDFWEIGASAGWLITACVAVHPVEIVDFLAGFAMVDLKGDDYAASSVAAEEMK